MTFVALRGVAAQGAAYVWIVAEPGGSDACRFARCPSGGETRVEYRGVPLSYQNLSGITKPLVEPTFFSILLHYLP
jgi:hypothetical protein